MKHIQKQLVNTHIHIYGIQTNKQITLNSYLFNEKSFTQNKEDTENNHIISHINHLTFT